MRALVGSMVCQSSGVYMRALVVCESSGVYMRALVGL